MAKDPILISSVGIQNVLLRYRNRLLIVTIMMGDVVVRLPHFLILTGDVVVPHIRDPMVGKRKLDVQMENIKRSGRMEEKY